MDIASGATAERTGSVYGTFRLGDEEFGINAIEIREVINAPAVLNANPLYPDYVLGTYTLRDIVIPVVSVDKLFARGVSSAAADAKVAIIDYYDHPIGFLFDHMGDVFDANNASCDFVECTDVRQFGAHLGAFWFPEQERLVQLLDTHRMIEHRGLAPPKGLGGAAAASDRAASHRGEQSQCMAFELGEMSLAVDLFGVAEVVEGGTVEDREIATGALLGMHDLRGEPVPLVDVAAVLGLRDSQATDSLHGQSIIIVEHANACLGLVVDRINDLIHYFDDQLLGYPSYAQALPELIPACIRLADGSELPRMNLDAFLQTASLLSILETCGVKGSDEQMAQVDDPVAPQSESVAYLVCQVDVLYAIALSEVVEVVERPDDLVRPPLLSDHIDGILNLRGEFVATTSASSLYDSPDTIEPSRHIIVFGKGERRIGLAVPAVRSIVHVRPEQKQKLPQLLHQPDACLQTAVCESWLLQSNDSAQPMALSVLDLNRIVDRIEHFSRLSE